jgi:hypothetical protein
MRSLLLVIALFAGAALRANEPLWTDDERAKQRDAVIDGAVVSVRRISKLSETADLFRADIKIHRVRKPHENLPADVVAVYFALGPKGADSRCPTYADPKSEQIGTFYLRYHHHLTAKHDFVLEMGRDVRK